MKRNIGRSEEKYRRLNLLITGKAKTPLEVQWPCQEGVGGKRGREKFYGMKGTDKGEMGRF